MLVVDVHALEPVDLLDFIDEVGGKLLHALDRQNVVRRRIAVDDVIALLDDVSVLKVDVLALRDQILDGVATLLVRDDRDAGLVLVVAAELHRAGDFRDDRVILRTARFEQFRDARQTAGDVAGLGRIHRDTRHRVARLHRAARLDRDDRVDRQRVARVAAAGELADLAVRALDHNRRLQRGRALVHAPVGDHALGDAGRFVGRLAHGLAFQQVLEADDAVDFRQDRAGIGVPLGQALTALDLVALVHLQARAVLHAMHRAIGAVRPDDDDGDVARHHHELAVRIAREVTVADLHHAVEVRLDEALVRDLRRAADVERAHGELRARLADRLRRDHADRFAHVHRRAAREIAPVALAADAVLGLAGQHRADLHFLDAGRVDPGDVPFLDQFAGRHDHIVVGVLHVFGGGAAENTGAERSHDLTGVDDGAHANAAGRAAVIGRDDRILRDVDQTAGQVTRVRRLERRIGKTLARAVRRVEVLENGQAFLEVRDDRALDDLARRLGHQAAHGGELAHLRGRTTRAGMRHHVDRVDRLVAAVLVLTDGRNALHHLFGELVRAFRPGVDHLVVLLALRDQAVVVLLLVFLGGGARRLDDVLLRRRHDHVVLAEGNARLERLAEAQRHDAVAEDDRLLLPAIAVDGVDHRRDLFLRHQLVGDVEGDLRMLGQELAEQQTAGSRVEDLRHAIALLVIGPGAALDLGVQRHGLGRQRMLDLAHVGIGAADRLALRALAELARLAVAIERQIVEAENDVLRRHDDRLAVGRMQDVVRRHHQHARFQLRLER